MCESTKVIKIDSLLKSVIDKLNKRICDELFINLYKVGEKSFSRDRFFTFKVLVCFLMTNLQKGLQREIALFQDAITINGGRIPEVDKSAFCKARNKLKPEAFSALSNIVTDEFYESDQVLKWNGLRVFGGDGSTVELPNSTQIKDKYGIFKHRKDGKPICMGRVLMVYDTLNHLTIHGSIASIEESETSMLWKCLPDLKVGKDDILVFDRLYASHLLFFYLQKLGVQFCFRMKKDWWKMVETFYGSGQISSVVALDLPKKDYARAAELGIIQTTLRCRLTRIELDGGETEILLSTLIDEDAFSVADTKELYGLRWPIEDAYKTFKHKVCVENFSGKSDRAVLQDFYVKIFIMNLTAVAIRPINEALKKQSVKVKHVHQVNLIEAIASMKRAVVSFFVTKNIGQAIKRIYRKLSKTTEPIRPGRSFKRNHQPKQKHYMNQKAV